MRSTATLAFVLGVSSGCSSTSTHTVERTDSAGGTSAIESGAGASDSGTSESGNGDDGAPGQDGSPGSGVDCPGDPPCARAVYHIDNPVSGITQMDPYQVLEMALGPDRALGQQTAASDDVLTAGAETYLFFVLSCAAGRQYGVTWEGRADAAGTRQVLIAVADGSYVATQDWPTAVLSEVPDTSDVKHTARGLIPDALGNIFVRVNSFGGYQFTDWLAVGSCI